MDTETDAIKALNELVARKFLLEEDEDGQKYYTVTPEGLDFIWAEGTRAITAMSKCPSIKLVVPFEQAVKNFINRQQKEHKTATGVLIFMYRQSLQTDLELQAQVNFEIDPSEKGIGHA
jgi:hypothetical protein